MNNTAEVVFILDRSGSMHGKEADIIGGFNSMIRKRQEEDMKAYISTVMFSDDSEVLHDRLEISQVPVMTEKDYVTQSCTALLDAVGDAIKHIRNIHKYARPEDRPDKTMFIIMTDGYENASHRYDHKQLKRLVERQKEKGWEFIFIGADIDAFAVAESVGVGSKRAVHFSKAKDSYEDCFDAVGEAVSCYMAAPEPLSDQAFDESFKMFKRSEKDA